MLTLIAYTDMVRNVFTTILAVLLIITWFSINQSGTFEPGSWFAILAAIGFTGVAVSSLIRWLGFRSYLKEGDKS